MVEVAVLVHEGLGPGQPAAVDDARVVEGVREDDIARAGEGLDDTGVGPGTAPAAITSTSFNLDYYGASQRACFEGLTTWLGNGYGPGNLLGCAGWWYNGGSWLDEASSGNYRRNIQSRITTPPWHAWAGWPG